MEFKAGDRVHVTRYNNENVDFYTTLKNVGAVAGLTDRSDGGKIDGALYLPGEIDFGPDKEDYYTLATDEDKYLRWSDGSTAEGKVIIADEEDTEEPVIQRTTDNVNHPTHYNFGDIEVVDFIEQVTKHYNSDVAYHIGNAIKYLARSPHKNGKEDIAKAKWYIERAYEKWE
ncbi:DUF3310 domain-containing protein [Mammaliicoccus vitulinus]|nr:DUF3310 domain-containing protein [Mammaliicoccus vitulinus]